MDVESVLAQRELDLNTFMQQRHYMDTLIKMMAKIKESIRGSTTFSYQQQQHYVSCSKTKLLSVFLSP